MVFMQKLRLNSNYVENQADKTLHFLYIIWVWFMCVYSHFQHFFSFIATSRLTGKWNHRQTYRTDRWIPDIKVQSLVRSERSPHASTLYGKSLVWFDPNNTFIYLSFMAYLSVIDTWRSLLDLINVSMPLKIVTWCLLCSLTAHQSN
jgi:hypothetical protein